MWVRVKICGQLKVCDDNIFLKSVDRQLEAHLRETTFACMIYSACLHCILLEHAILYCTALHCTALHYTTLYYTTKICIAPSRQAKRCGRVAYRLNYIKGIGPIVPAFFLTFRPIHIINCLSNKYLYRIVRLLLPTYKYSTQFERGSSSIQAIRVCQSG